jgi:hypothetical protein
MILVVHPGSGAFLTPGSGMGKKIRIRIRDEKPGIILKYLNSLMWIRVEKNSDPG